MNEQSLFAQVLDIPDPANRAAFLDRACGGDPDLRRRLERLLERHAVAGSFLEQPVLMSEETLPFVPEGEVEAPGTVIGQYKLLEAVGEGGMGVVYVAEQAEPVRRKVALKVIKPGMDSKQVVARFEAERQALALMDHPNIASVHDGGSTDFGRPFFVMELVRGLPVTEYCDRVRLPVRERLALFVQVCRAVQHAHQKGVIHRDLKPSNVLVTVIDGSPVPKVIDFGIVKATGAALTDRSLHTGFHQLVGTPLYMSPEQAEFSGVDVDTRSDVYSLGVLLYELLTGTTPFDPDTMRRAGLDEMRRMIREDEPARPSKRLSTLAAGHSSTVGDRRDTDPRRLGRMMRHELDWVVMRALEKDRNRRYESASAFAADVERYLADAPVEACPPSVRYRVGKFVRRHRAALATAAILAAALLVAAGTVGWTMRNAAIRQSAAEQAAKAALDESAEHYRAERPDAAMASAKRAVDTLAGVPGADRLRGEAQQQVADLVMAERLEELRLARLEEGSSRGAEVAAAIIHSAFKDYGIDPVELTETEAAERIRARLIAAELVEGLDGWEAARQQFVDPNDPLAGKLRAIAAAADADSWSRRVREIIREGTPEQLSALAAEIPIGTALPAAVYRLSLALNSGGRRGEAERLLRTAIRLHPDNLLLHFTLANLLMVARSESAHLESLGFYRTALAIRPRSAVIRHRIGILLTDGLNRPEEGADWFREVLRLKPDFHLARQNLSIALNKQGKYDESLALMQEAIAAQPDADMYYSLGLVLSKLGRKAEAAEAYQTVLGLEPKAAEDHFWRGMTLEQLGRRDDAITSFREVMRRRPNNPLGYAKVGFLLSERGDHDEAMTVYRKALEIHPDNALFHSRLGVLLRREGKLDGAVAEYQKAIRLEPKTPSHHFNLGNVLVDLKRFDDAADAYDKAIACDPKYALPHLNLGDLFLRQGRFADALASYQRGHELGTKQPNWPYRTAELIETSRRLVALEPRLPAILAGADTPSNPADTAAIARVASARKRHARAAELYRAAISADPKVDHRYSGACAAALAGCGQGEDAARLDDAARTAWRKQALEWLRAELAVRDKLLASGTAAVRRAELDKLRRWFRDADLIEVRDDGELAKLPDAERAEWKQFWAEVRAVEAKASVSGRK